MTTANRHHSSVGRTTILIALLATRAFVVCAQESSQPALLINFLPGLIVPVGEFEGNALRFGVGLGVSVGSRIGTSPLFVGGRVGVARHNYRFGDDTFTNISLLGTAGGFLSNRPSLAVTAEVGAGVRAGFDSSGNSTAGLGIAAGFGVDTAFGRVIRIGTRLEYEGWIGQYHAIGLELSGTLAIARSVETEEVPRSDRDRRTAPVVPGVVGEGAAGDESIGDAAGLAESGSLVIAGLEIDRVFPVFHKYYDENPVGYARIQNSSDEPISNIRIEFEVPRYMDSARVVAGPDELSPGAAATIPITALFADNIMDVTTPTLATGRLTVRYVVDGVAQELAIDQSVEIAHRNAMTWDDNRKAAAFVTPNDPALQVLARGAAAVVRDGGYELVNEPFRYAAGVYEAIRDYGIQYVVDPNTPFAELSRQEDVIDYLQFPGQTVQVRGGDCDDLSICFAAAMHAIGFEAAFVTVPGHIFAAVNTGLSAVEASREFSRMDDLIVYNAEVWLPIELTNLDSGFLEAWEQGAQQWREYEARGEAGIHPILEAWGQYEPAGLRDDYYRPPGVDADSVSREYRSQIRRYIDLRILPRVSELQEQIARSDNDPRVINRLGVLYARFDLRDRAIAQFELALEQDAGNCAALVNLGNLEFIESRFSLSLDYYSRAAASDPDQPVAILGVARANHALENYGSASQAYARLARLDPALAARFAYLDYGDHDAARAAQLSLTNDVVWSE